MSDEKMPAAEAAELNSYELAFHVLPTVAEGEVAGVFAAIKDQITKTGATLTDEETPERFDLAYEIVKHLEGKNRKFSSAYFGWVRFQAEAEAIAQLDESLESNNNILRHLLIKLTKAEEAHPFRFHEALVSEKMVTTVEESSVVPDVTTVTSDDSDDLEDEVEEGGEVDETELDAALKKEEVE